MVADVCKVGVFVIAFATSCIFRYLVVATIVEICNSNHLRTYSNCSCKKKFVKTLFLSPLQSVIILLVSEAFFRPLKNKKLMFKKFYNSSYHLQL